MITRRARLQHNVTDNTTTENTSGWEFLRFLLQVGALEFGEFTLKSGRVSPYYFNSARFRTGLQLQRLGEFFAVTIAKCAPDAEIVFGPAYKGIPLCVSAAMALSRNTGREIGYLFDRKEAKAHGDKGRFVGMEPAAGTRLVMVDDVITDGVTKLEAVKRLNEAYGATIDALVIAFNRMERDESGGNAAGRFQQETGIPVVALFSLEDLEEALAASAELTEPTEAREPAEPLREGEGRSTTPPLPSFPPGTLERLRDYRRRYGVQR